MLASGWELQLTGAYSVSEATSPSPYAVSLTLHNPGSPHDPSLASPPGVLSSPIWK